MTPEARIGELEGIVATLRLENERLSADAQDALLIGRLGEILHKAESKSAILAPMLEVISTFKDLRFCMTGVEAVDGFDVDAVYGPLAAGDHQGCGIRPAPELFASGWVERLLEGDEVALAGLDGAAARDFRPRAVLVVRCGSRSGERRAFFFADDVSADRLRGARGVLARTVDMAKARLDNLTLVAALEGTTRALDARVLERSAALQLAAGDLERFFSLALDLFCIADLDGTFRKLNAAWERTLGYPISELEGRSFMALVHPDDREATESAVAALASGRNVINFTNRYRCHDGTYRWIEWRSAPHRGYLIYAAARDVTERVVSERALRDSEQRFRSIIWASPMGIHMYRLEPDGRLIFSGSNPAADAILGVENDEFVGRTIEEAFPPLAATEVPERYRRACASGEPWDTEQVTYTDGRIQGAFEVHAFQTEPGSMAVLFRDITERKRAELERARPG